MFCCGWDAVRYCWCPCDAARRSVFELFELCATITLQLDSPARCRLLHSLAVEAVGVSRRAAREAMQTLPLTLRSVGLSLTSLAADWQSLVCMYTSSLLLPSVQSHAATQCAEVDRAMIDGSTSLYFACLNVEVVAVLALALVLALVQVLAVAVLALVLVEEPLVLVHCKYQCTI